MTYYHEYNHLNMCPHVPFDLDSLPAHLAHIIAYIMSAFYVPYAMFPDLRMCILPLFIKFSEFEPPLLEMNISTSNRLVSGT